MGAGLLGQQEWDLQKRFGCPPQIWGSSRGPAGVLFLDLAPYLAMGAQVGALLELLLEDIFGEAARPDGGGGRDGGEAEMAVEEAARLG